MSAARRALRAASRLRPGLRTRLLLLLGALHVAVAAFGAAALSARPAALLALEAALVVSVLLSAALLRALFVPLQLVRTGAELLREGDFTVRIAPTGLAEVDAMAEVYNRMAERLRSERARAAEQDLFLQRLVDASPAGVVTLDFDGLVSLVSPSAERLLGLSARAHQGVACADLPGIGSELASLPPQGSRLIERDGRSLRVRRAELHDRGFPRTFFLVEELTDELAASEREAYERIVQVMAHEVRNTVGVVRSLLDSVAGMDAREAPPAGTEAGAVADRDGALGLAAQRLLRLNSFMNGVADVVRLPPPARAPCDVGELVRAIVALAAPEAEARGLKLSARCATGLSASLDAGQIEQALLNVLRNAFEATPAGGSVTVELRREPGGATLRVRDGGPGIAPELAPRLFTPFFTTRPQGRGIGLMLVREVLLRHGLPHALATHPDGGAEMLVRFPQA